MPLVDGRVELQAGVGAGPGGQADAIPQVARLDLLGDAAVGAAHEVPGLVLLDRLQVGVRHANGVVGVLARDRGIRLRLPVDVVGAELDGGVALPRELADALDVALRNRQSTRMNYRYS